MTNDIRARLYNAFDPSLPLSAGSKAYINLNAVRGDGDILEKLGEGIILSNKPICQLYAGHRGAGKSTELLRLQKYLTDQGYQVIYFAADAEDLDPENTEYTDILLACTRQILQSLKSKNDNLLLKWVNDRWREFKEAMLSDITVEKLDVEASILEFAKLTATLRASPNARTKIRALVEPTTPSLIDALNEFIRGAIKETNKLVVIADNLDRIVPIFDENRSNHDRIFIDRSEQLKALDCHVIYTVPISMVFSDRATRLEECYSSVQRLPMIMVKKPTGIEHAEGISKLKEIVLKRINNVAALLTDEEQFDNEDTFKHICLLSGGHVRNLTTLMRSAIQYSRSLPITARAAQKAITELRSTYRDSISHSDWPLLAQVHQTKQIFNDDAHRRMLFNRYILEYQCVDSNDNDEVKPWYDIHPVIQGIERFQEAINSINKIVN